MSKPRCAKCDSKIMDQAVRANIDGKVFFVCRACLDKERAAMLRDPDHPGWAFYDILVSALKRAGVDVGGTEH